jgi:hypothetical protein
LGDKDLEQVKKWISNKCICTTGERGFTAEFGLDGSAVNSFFFKGGGRTALLQVLTDRPHSELGGGLFCLLQMPVSLSNVEQACAQLNKTEMAAQDLPPHFGAWCVGQFKTNPAYISFFPNELHRFVGGIAVNIAIWANERANWANRILGSMHNEPRADAPAQNSVTPAQARIVGGHRL